MFKITLNLNPKTGILLNEIKFIGMWKNIEDAKSIIGPMFEFCRIEKI
jgi:hypothetical protein